MWLFGLVVAGLPLAAAAGKDVPRISIKSGTPQTAQAWVAARANRYETKFDAALVVRVAPAKTKVRFRCITRGCEFPASDQPDSVSRVDASTYDVASAKGEASIKLTIWTATPENVVVVAQPAGAAQPQVRFILNEH
jgi:hypothetical protein